MIARELRLGDDFAPVDYAAWRRVVEADLEGVPFEKKLVARTHEGIDIQPIYSEETAPTGGDPSGFPGLPPFVRGTRALGDSADGWEIRQEYDHPDPAEVNAQVLDDLRHGATAVELRLDRASSLGLDADDARAGGLPGPDGVVFSTAGDLERALAGVCLDETPLVLSAGGAYLPAAALAVAALRGRGIASSHWRGGFQGDPIGALLRVGELPVPIERALSQLGDLATWTVRNAPGLRAAAADSRVAHEAGASDTQDLAILIATGLEYLRALTGAGLEPGTAARQVAFSMSVDGHVFQAIAKVRAARWLWSRVVSLCGGDAEAQGMSLRVAMSRRILTARAPWANVLRATACTFAAAVAGADAITTIPPDAALGPSDENGRRQARNVQLLLRDEGDLHRVVDPAGGSWFLETLTRQMAEAAWGLIREIEAEGGMVAAVRSGWVGRAVGASVRLRERAVATRSEPITGVTEHPDLAETPARRPRPDRSAMAASARERLAAWRRGHPCDEVLRALAELARSESPTPGAVTEAAIRAAEAGATLGTLAAALRVEGGEPLRVEPLVARPDDRPFEELRDAADALEAARGARPLAFLAGVGSVAEQSARMAFARELFEVGGFATAAREGPADVAEAADAFAASGARVAVICSTDAIYETAVEALAPRLKAAGARSVVLAGRPGPLEARFRAAGVDRFVYVKCDALETLRSLLLEEGATIGHEPHPEP